MNILVSDWPKVPDRFKILPSGYELRYSEELDVLVVWCPEAEKHVALPQGHPSKGRIEYAVAMLEQSLHTGWIH